MIKSRTFLYWAAFALALAVPIGFAATSPLLAWRQPIYIAAGLAGVAAMALLLVQPLLIGGHLPGLAPRSQRALHRLNGALLTVLVTIHVAGLWITSPPDMIDALTFTSPTPFSAYGVIAMWAVFASAMVALARRRIRPRHWRIAHKSLVIVIVLATLAHAVQVDGTMETISKWILAFLILVAAGPVLLGKRNRP